MTKENSSSSKKSDMCIELLMCLSVANAKIMNKNFTFVKINVLIYIIIFYELFLAYILSYEVHSKMLNIILPNIIQLLILQRNY